MASIARLYSGAALQVPQIGQKPRFLANDSLKIKYHLILRYLLGFIAPESGLTGIWDTGRQPRVFQKPWEFHGRLADRPIVELLAWRSGLKNRLVQVVTC